MTYLLISIRIALLVQVQSHNCFTASAVNLVREHMGQIEQNQNARKLWAFCIIRVCHWNADVLLVNYHTIVLHKYIPVYHRCEGVCYRCFLHPQVCVTLTSLNVPSRGALWRKWNFIGFLDLSVLSYISETVSSWRWYRHIYLVSFCWFVLRVYHWHPFCLSAELIKARFANTRQRG